MLHEIDQGNQETIFINSANVGAFTGSPAPKGGNFGMIAAVNTSSSSDWDFRDLTIHALAQ